MGYEITVSIAIDGEPKGSETYAYMGSASEAIGALRTYITRNTYGMPTDGRETVIEVYGRGSSGVICNLSLRYKASERWTVTDRITGETRRWDGLGHTLGRVGHHPD